MSVLIIEKEESFRRGISSRNSKVIHPGIYYPPNTLKSKYCFKGRELLYEFCEKHSIWHNRYGKIIIGQKNQEKEINDLYENALINFVPDIAMLSKKDIEIMESHISAEFGFFIGCSGIIFSHY